jgi:hypothetical protein
VDLPFRPDRTIQKDLDIQEYTDPEHNPMIPHTLVLKPDLVIYSIYNPYWFWGHPSVIDLWHDLRAVTSEIRPDWDLSTPGLREAWNVVTSRVSTGGTIRPVWKIPRLYGTNSTATNFDLLWYQIAPEVNHGRGRPPLRETAIRLEESK